MSESFTAFEEPKSPSAALAPTTEHHGPQPRAMTDPAPEAEAPDDDRGWPTTFTSGI